MRILLSVGIAALLFSACQSSNQNTTTNETEIQTTTQPAAPPQSKLGDAGTTKVLSLLTEYYALKDAFVKSDVKATQEQAKRVQSAADSLSAFLKADSAAANAGVLHTDSIRTASGHIVAATDNNIETQRAYFETVSNNAYALMKELDVKNAKIYHQYCPMALDNKGAFWLSSEAEIKNPYFGKKMLECGEVADSLQ